MAAPVYEYELGVASLNKYRRIGGVRVVRCPAEYLDIGCKNCGGKDGPLCARLNRDFVIGFTAHGSGKKKAADPDQRGGCYAAGGNVAMHWRAMPGKPQPRPDPEAVAHFVKTLPATAIVRHHVAGDIGAGVEPAPIKPSPPAVPWRGGLSLLKNCFAFSDLSRIVSDDQARFVRSGFLELVPRLSLAPFRLTFAPPAPVLIRARRRDPHSGHIFCKIQPFPKWRMKDVDQQNRQ